MVVGAAVSAILRDVVVCRFLEAVADALANNESNAIAGVWNFCDNRLTGLGLGLLVVLLRVIGGEYSRDESVRSVAEEKRVGLSTSPAIVVPFSLLIFPYFPFYKIYHKR